MSNCCKCSEPNTIWCGCRGRRSFCLAHFSEHMVHEHGLDRDEVLELVNDCLHATSKRTAAARHGSGAKAGSGNPRGHIRAAAVSLTGKEA